MIWNTL